jgi:ribonuclease HI
VDASKNPISDFAGIGGLLRRGDRQFIAGFMQNIQFQEVFEAELLAVREGLKFALAKGCSALQVQFDSLQVVKLLNSMSYLC